MRNWKYETKTEDAVCEALLRLLASKRLADVTVSELAREAHVSRTTFYEHYDNVADVYDGIVARFARELPPMLDQVACSSGMAPHAEPFCARLRADGPLSPAIGEDRFLSTFLNTDGSLEGHDLYGILTGAGYTPEQARALSAFQLAGCFTAARTAPLDDNSWHSVKPVIDRFILGGIAACLAAKRETD